MVSAILNASDKVIQYVTVTCVKAVDFVCIANRILHCY